MEYLIITLLYASSYFPKPCELKRHKFMRDCVAVEYKEPNLHPSLRYGPVVANVYDAITTQSRLSNSREANPVLRTIVGNRAVFYTVKFVGSYIIGEIANLLYTHGHKNMAKILSSFAIAFPLASGSYNLTR